MIIPFLLHNLIFFSNKIDKLQPTIYYFWKKNEEEKFLRQSQYLSFSTNMGKKWREKIHKIAFYKLYQEGLFIINQRKMNQGKNWNLSF